MYCFKYLLFSLMLLAMLNGNAQVDNIRVQKVWEAAPHNAFPDIRFYKGYFYLVFREGNSHVPETENDDGKIRVLRSANAKEWQPFQVIAKKGLDLRDPMLEITSDDHLMLLMGGSDYDHKKLKGAFNQVSFLQAEFTPPQPVRYSNELISTHNWLWSITWHNGTGYGIIYQFEPGKKNKLMLAATANGVDYSLKTDLQVTGNTSESKALFVNKRKMIMVVRRDGNPDAGAFGFSKKPFTKWKFSDMNIQLGGPHLIRLNRRYQVLSTRSFKDGKAVCTTLFLMNNAGKTRKVADLPECGPWDCSYPGMEIHNGKLYVSYYSSHEGKAKIYIADLPVSDLKRIIRKK